MLEIDCRHVELCDELWICGPKVCGNESITTTGQDSKGFYNLSSGMLVEVLHGLKNKVKVVDMRHYLELVT